MRPSHYLNAVEIGDGSCLLYNGLSMCIDAVPSDIARQLLVSGESADTSFLSSAEIEHLVRRGHLTELTMEDEQEELRRLTRAIAERDAGPNGQSFSERTITFILTYRCNLSCAYCYQNPVRGASADALMSEGFVDDFFHNYLDELFPGISGDRLRFILFGGEPLVPGNRRTIERILEHAGKHKSVVSAVTNAIMVPQMLDLIGPHAGKINNVQVTLDGEQTFHDRTRVARSGAPTFERMVHAIHALIGAKAHTAVRVHLHPDGFASAEALVEYLDREKILGDDNVEIYFAPVHSFHAKDISPSDFDVFSRIFQYVALKQKHPPIQNFDFLQDVVDMTTARNWSQPRYCAVSTGTHCAVDPLGDIYECLEEAGRRERRTGALSGGKIEYFKLRETYRKRYLAGMPECSKCSIALICGGGCISRARTQDGAVLEQFCRQNKLFVAETLKACFLLKQSGRAYAGANPAC